MTEMSVYYLDYFASRNLQNLFSHTDILLWISLFISLCKYHLHTTCTKDWPSYRGCHSKMAWSNWANERSKYTSKWRYWNV